jgi:hypothetical protein
MHLRIHRLLQEDSVTIINHCIDCLTTVRRLENVRQSVPGRREYPYLIDEVLATVTHGQPPALAALSTMRNLL